MCVVWVRWRMATPWTPAAADQTPTTSSSTAAVPTTPFTTPRWHVLRGPAYRFARGVTFLLRHGTHWTKHARRMLPQARQSCHADDLWYADGKLLPWKHRAWWRDITPMLRFDRCRSQHRPGMLQQLGLWRWPAKMLQRETGDRIGADDRVLRNAGPHPRRHLSMLRRTLDLRHSTANVLQWCHPPRPVLLRPDGRPAYRRGNRAVHWHTCHGTTEPSTPPPVGAPNFGGVGPDIGGGFAPRAPRATESVTTFDSRAPPGSPPMLV